jgi:bZIP transcription factor
MQNRESAVRSRMRKTCYQEILEEKLQRLEKITKEMSE